MENSRGQIITFYSYKGGTGRSMALANIACILAERQAANGGKGVLMIDWDLEAPGLHRYFQDRLVSSKFGMERVEKEESLDAKPGLIDLFVKLDEETDRQTESLINEKQTNTDTEGVSLPVIGAEELAQAALEAIDLQQYTLPTNINKLHLIKAGRFNPEEPNEYSQRVNKFNWETLYKKSPQLIRMFADKLAELYDYVLIDSRTGITDISGVCTMILPETLVVVFTPNVQSLRGALHLIKQATDYRKESADLRPLMVFPLVSRVENSEPTLKHDWRYGNKHISGYQPEFEKLLAEIYDDEISFNKYFGEMQIQHMPRYAYGEAIAVLEEKLDDRLSLRRSYYTFAKKLIEGRAPWEGEIRESTDAGAFKTGFEMAGAFFDTFSLSGATRQARSVIILFLVSAAILSSVVAYSQFQQARAAERLSIENQKLLERVKELEDPIQGILKENNSRIADLTTQVNNLTQARDAAQLDANTQKDLLTKAQDQLRNAASVQKQLQAAREDAMQAKIDAQNADDARQSALAKYTDSQNQIRRLEAQLAKCGRN